jgi:hypothetical protein
MKLISTLKRIRACENEAAAQLLFEKYLELNCAAIIEECAKAIEASNTYDSYDPHKFFADLVRGIKELDPESPERILSRLPDNKWKRIMPPSDS